MCVEQPGLYTFRPIFKSWNPANWLFNVNRNVCVCVCVHKSSSWLILLNSWLVAFQLLQKACACWNGNLGVGLEGEAYIKPRFTYGCPFSYKCCIRLLIHSGHECSLVIPFPALLSSYHVQHLVHKALSGGPLLYTWTSFAIHQHVLFCFEKSLAV